MFPRFWERAVAYFSQMMLAAFSEAERRTDAVIAQRFEFPGGAAAGQPLDAVGPPPPLPPVQPPGIAAPGTPVALPHIPPPAIPPALGHGQKPPPRPRGRPRKEPPKC